MILRKNSSTELRLYQLQIHSRKGGEGVRRSENEGGNEYPTPIKSVSS